MQKAVEKELACKFVRIDPDKEGVNEIFRHIKQLFNKESSIDKISIE